MKEAAEQARRAVQERVAEEKRRVSSLERDEPLVNI